MGLSESVPLPDVRGERWEHPASFAQAALGIDAASVCADSSWSPSKRVNISRTYGSGCHHTSGCAAHLPTGGSQG